MRRSELPRGGPPAVELSAVEDSIERAWAALLAEHAIPAGSPAEADLAELVLEGAQDFSWRVVDAPSPRCTARTAEPSEGPDRPSARHVSWPMAFVTPQANCATASRP